MKISEAIELFKYNWRDKISIVMMYDDGGAEEKLEPTLYKDIKFAQVKDLLKYEVYSVWIEPDEDNKPHFEISYCDPHGEWK
jgi:hypothetical protein